MQLRTFCVLKHSVEWNGEQNSAQFNYKLLLSGSQHAYVYNQSEIICCSGKKEIVYSTGWRLKSYKIVDGIRKPPILRVTYALQGRVNQSTLK